MQQSDSTPARCWLGASCGAPPGKIRNVRNAATHPRADRIPCCAVADVAANSGVPGAENRPLVADNMEAAKPATVSGSGQSIAAKIKLASA